MRRFLAFVAALVAILSAAVSHADDAVVAPPRFEVETSLGLGTPVGVFGEQVSFAPIDALAFQVGAGINGANEAQFSAMARLRATTRRPDGFRHFDIGLGVSGGPFT